MFSDALIFNGDLSGWDVSSVVDMFGMFSDARIFNCNLRVVEMLQKQSCPVQGLTEQTHMNRHTFRNLWFVVLFIVCGLCTWICNFKTSSIIKQPFFGHRGSVWSRICLYLVWCVACQEAPNRIVCLHSRDRLGDCHSVIAELSRAECCDQSANCVQA